MKRNKILCFTMLLLCCVVIALGTSMTAQASIVEYSGLDAGVGSGGARPNSDAAAAAFDGAVGPYGLINFENLDIGNFTSLDVATGVTVTLANTASDGNAGITDTVSTDLGYNTTTEGLKHLRVVPIFFGNDVSVTFAFANPIDFFGAYLTGTETYYAGTITLNFNDGSSQNLGLTKNPLGGGVQFFGFTDLGTSISSVVFAQVGPFDSTRDIWGIDDIRYGRASVPEPTIMVLLGLGLIGLAGIRRKM